MSAGSGSPVRVIAPGVAGALVSTGLAVVVNLATGGGPWWLWVAVVVLTAAGCGTSLWLYQRQASPTGPTVTAAGAGSVAAHGTVGNISISSAGAAPAGVPPPAGGQESVIAPVPGAVTASGTGSVAISGTVGDISTGHQIGQPPA
ncbi:hypothetical protein ACFWPX_36420 [Nocardia sp. NPDC058518]|uniref:hypothetical protein n=1 Tax=Nocardia sp. NPDC058518 TaxID=3346534 RepID=UPI003652ED09